MEENTNSSSNLRHRYASVNSRDDDKRGSDAATSFRPMPKEMRLYYKLKASVICAVAAYLLHWVNFYHTILHSPKINHVSFRVGMACTVAILGLKSYVELFEGKVQKKVVDYKNYRQTTHLILFLLITASLAFHVALWPAYGAWKTIGIMLCVGYGVLLQFCIVVPPWLQNLVGFVLCTYFLQEYL